MGLAHQLTESGQVSICQILYGIEHALVFVHEKAIYAPIWQLGFINAIGPRVGESSFGTIPGFAYTAPFEDLTLKG